jgi:hypothetical protein
MTLALLNLSPIACLHAAHVAVWDRFAELLAITDPRCPSPEYLAVSHEFEALTARIACTPATRCEELMLKALSLARYTGSKVFAANDMDGVGGALALSLINDTMALAAG